MKNLATKSTEGPEIFQLEKEKLETLDRELGAVAELSLEKLRTEALGYLRGRESRTWKSINTNKGSLINPSLQKDGKVSADSNHNECEILQAIVCIERWHTARRSAGASRAAVTRKRNALMRKQLSELCKTTKTPTREQLIAALTVK